MSLGAGAPGAPASEGGSFDAPKHTKAPAGPSEDDYQYEEDEPEQAPISVRAGPSASKGSEAFDSVKNGARYTLRGLRHWQSAAQWGTIGQFFGLIAAVLLVVQLVLTFMGIFVPGTIGLAGMFLGVGTLVFWLVALVHFLFGMRWARAGRDELGYLQRREVDAAVMGLMRGGMALLILGLAAAFLGLQAQTFGRAGRMPDAALMSLVFGALAAVFGVYPVARGVAGMLRNLTPTSGKKGRRNFVRVLMVWAVPSVAVYLVGASMAYIDYDVACTELGGCRAAELLPLISPPYGAPANFAGEPPVALYLELPMVVAVVLLISRLAGSRALRKLRDQLAEADRFLVYHVAAHPSAIAPSSLAI